MSEQQADNRQQVKRTGADLYTKACAPNTCKGCKHSYNPLLFDGGCKIKYPLKGKSA